MTTTPADTPDSGARSRLLTLVFTDLSNSVGLKTRLGDTDAGRLISSHHKAIRDFAAATGGREILVAGDGCFLTFETPSHAVEFGLRLQDFHRQNPGLPQVRIGMHMGEVTEKVTTSVQGEKIEVDGLAVDIASRIQSLAHPKQILMSYVVFDNARQRLDPSALALPVEWRAHGRYVFRGSDMALEVFEAGLKGVASFAPPSGSTKAHRDVNTDEEDTLGWRPAQGLELPGRSNWVLIEKLGEGGFGDVWLAEHRKTKDRHVIKFCYSADRLRTLKREVTLFRLLRETLGDRPDIARVLDYQFETNPYFVEMEFAGRHNLTAWLQEHGGVDNIPLETRLEVVAQVAEAIAAAHSVGVLHKDIKPSNIMVTVRGSARHPRVRMIDFGIGALADRGLLDMKGITATGLTEVESSPEYASSMAGTRLYMAPELIEGKPATTKSDIYSLGVLLYQLASGNMGHSLSFGWERDIPDETLREDIQACVDGRPENRLVSAEELAKRIRHLPQRRAIKEAERLRLIRRATNRKRRKWFYASGALLVVAIIFVAQYARLQAQRAGTEEQLRMRAEDARREAQQQTLQTIDALKEARQAQYFGAIALAEASLRESRFEKVQDVLLTEAPRDFLQREWGWLLAQTAPEDFAMKNFDIFHAVFSPDGERIIVGDRDKVGHGFVSVYDARTARRISRVKSNVRLVWNLAVSPDGKYAATASSDRYVSIVDLQTSKIVVKLTENKGIVRDVAFSPDGKLLASCSRDNTIRLWKTDTFKLESEIRVPGDSFTEIAFSPDSNYLAAGSLESHVRIFDVNTGIQVSRLTEHQDRVLSVVFLNDGTGVVTACKDGVTRVFPWGFPAGENGVLQPVLSVRSENSYPAQVMSSPDGNSIYIGNDNGLIRKVDAKTGLDLHSIQVDQPLWKMDLCDGGKRMLTTTRWSMRMLDLERIEATSTVEDWTDETSVPESAVKIRLSSVSSLRDQTWNADQPWRTTSGISLVTLPRGKQFTVHSALDIYSPDLSQHVKIDPVSLHVTVKDTASSNVLFNGGSKLCSGAAFSPDGKLATLLFDQLGAQTFDTANWKLLHTVGQDRQTPVSVTYAPDGSQYIVGYLEGVIQSYAPADGRMIKELYSRAGAALSLDVSNDSRLLAAGLDLDRAIVVNLETGDQVSTMTGHVRYVHGVKFVPNSTRLSTLSRDGTVKLWDIGTGRELVTLFNLTDGVVPLGITFEPNGRHIHIAASDRRVATTDVFPWNLDVYGDEKYPLEDRVELWKRRVRLHEAVHIDDIVPSKEEVVGPPGLEPGTSRL